MNPKLERSMRVAALLFLLASLQFAVALGGPALALPATLVLAVAVTWLWIHFDLPLHPVWVLLLAIAAGSLVAITTVELTLSPNRLLWLAPPLAAGAAELTLFLLERNRARCNLCQRRLSSQSVVFRCPRCSMQVCDEHHTNEDPCWNFEHRRCRLCLEQRVPVLPTQDSWWLRAAGPRSLHGRCQLCLGDAATLDLRACPHCRRPQCRNCWDFQNGECARCGGALPHLPASLTTATAEVYEPPQAFSR